jgi:hypothetical protein
VTAGSLGDDTLTGRDEPGDDGPDCAGWFVVGVGVVTDDGPPVDVGIRWSLGREAPGSAGAGVVDGPGLSVWTWVG